MSSRKKNRISLGGLQPIDIESAIVDSAAPAPIPQQSISTSNPVPSSNNNVAPPSPSLENSNDDLSNEQQSMKKKRGSRSSGKFKAMNLDETPIVPIPPSEEQVAPPQAQAPLSNNNNMSNSNNEEFSQLEAKSSPASAASNKKKGGRNSGKYGAQKIDDNRLPSPSADAPAVQESTPKRNSGKFASVESTPEQQQPQPEADNDNASTPARNARSAKPPITPKNQSTPKHSTPKSSPAQQQQQQQQQSSGQDEELKKKLAETQSQLKSAEQENTKLQNIIASHSQHEQQSRELKQRIQHAEKDRDHYLALSESTRQDLEKERARLQKSDADLKSLTRKNDELRAEITKLEQRESLLNGTLVTAQGEKEKLLDQLKKESAKQKTLEVDLQRVQELLTAQEAQNKQDLKKIAELETKIVQIENEYKQKLQAEVQKSADALLRLQKQVDDASRNSNTKHEDQISSLQAEFSAEKQKSDAEVKKLKEKVASEQETNNKLKLIVADREKECKDAKKQAADNEKLVSDLKAKIANLEREREKAVSSVNEVASKDKATLANTIAHLNSDNEDLKKRVKELEEVVKQKSREALVTLVKETAMKISMESSSSKHSFANIALAAMDKNNKEKQQVPKHNASSILGNRNPSGLAIAALMAMNKTLADN